MNLADICMATVEFKCVSGINLITVKLLGLATKELIAMSLVCLYDVGLNTVDLLCLVTVDSDFLLLVVAYALKAQQWQTQWQGSCPSDCIAVSLALS